VNDVIPRHAVKLHRINSVVRVKDFHSIRVRFKRWIWDFVFIDVIPRHAVKLHRIFARESVVHLKLDF
jgi:hypothetical protein